MILTNETAAPAEHFAAISVDVAPLPVSRPITNAGTLSGYIRSSPSPCLSLSGKEVPVSIRLAMIITASFLVASPALADCKQELAMLEPSAISAETGASTDPSGVPITEHQEQVMPGNQTPSGETTGSTSDKVEAISPHQEQVTGGAAEHDQIAQMMTEARKLADAGNEAECMRKVAELKGLLGKK
jgi:hypothetical protein